MTLFIFYYLFDLQIDTLNEREWSFDEISSLEILAKNISYALERNINETIIQENEEKFSERRP